MNETLMTVSIGKLIAHPDNPNRMGKADFDRLIRNIEQTGLYEPLVVRPHPKRKNAFQIINGHHRCRALRKLGHKTAHVVVWDVTDHETDILLTTLNRLAGRDVLAKKLELLKRLNRSTSPAKLAKRLPHTRAQLQRLADMKPPSLKGRGKASVFAIPMVFFVNQEQQQTIENGLALVQVSSEQNRATRRAAALTQLADSFVGMARRSDE